jgi:hypothetical protein
MAIADTFTTIRLELEWFLEDAWEWLAFWGPQQLGRHWKRLPGHGQDNAVTCMNWDRSMCLRQWWDDERLHSEIVSSDDFDGIDLSAVLREIGALTQ